MSVRPSLLGCGAGGLRQPGDELVVGDLDLGLAD